MKKILKSKIKQHNRFLGLGLIAIFLFAISCEIPDPESVLDIRVQGNIFSHKANISITDLADQNNLNGNALKAKVTVLGNHISNTIVSEGGLYGDVLNISDGIGAFAVNPSYNGFTEPIDIELEIYGDNYLTKTVSLTINPEDTTTEINETVLNIGNVPDGVGVKLQDEILSGGLNTASISVSTDVSSDGTSADVNIPDGNIFKDENGNPITSGDLGIQIVYFDGNNDDASRASINGNVGSLVDENGETLTDVIIAPIATVDVNMSVGGTEVKEFDQPIEIIMDVNSEMINPNTGVKVAVGDEINIYSTNDNVNWSFLTKESISNVGGKLVIVFSTNHLTVFSAGFKVDICSNGKAKIKLPNDGDGFASLYLGTFIETESGAKTSTVGAKIGSDLVLVNAPSKNATLIMKPFFSTGNDIEINDIAWCSAGGSADGGITVPEAEKLKVEGVTVNANVAGKCTSTDSAIIPDNIKLFIDYAGDGTFLPAGIVRKGKIAIPGITLNKEYSLRVTYDGDTETEKYTFTSDYIEILDFKLPGDICAKLKL
jgi:hypothetical protein